MLCAVLALAGAIGHIGSLSAQGVVNFDASIVTPSTTAWPFSQAAYTVQTFWTPAQLSNTSGIVTEFGLQFVNPVDRAWPSVEIIMGESTNIMTNWNTTFLANYNVGTPVTVFNGPMSVTTTTTDELWRVPLQNTYNYSGLNQLVVTIRVNGLSTGTGTVSHRVQFTQSPGINLRNTVSNVTGTAGTLQINLGYGASFRFVPPGPVLTVAAIAGTPQTVFANAQGAGGSGVAAGSFTIASNNEPNSTLLSVDVEASGTANDATAYSELRLYRDDTAGANPGVFDAGDIAVAGPDVFPADDGTITFGVGTSEQGFGINDTRTYFIVVKLASAALPGQTLNFTISDITTGVGGKTVPSNADINGLIIDTPQFIFTDTSAMTAEKVFLTLSNVCQVFTVNYPNGPDDKPGSINVNSLGTADESTDLVNVQLWWDSDNDSAFSDTLDAQVDTQVFTQDDGLVSFSLATLSDFQAGDTRRFFVVYQLNANADDLETFRCYISDMGAAPLGGTPVGLPAPSANGTPGLEVSAAIIFGIMNGPTAPQTVRSDAANQLLADVTLDALPGGDWGVGSLIFHAGGTGSHNLAYTQLSLFEDAAPAGWDPGDQLAAPVLPGFVANEAVFDLTVATLLGGTQRRFFLVADLSGLAATNDTFGARLTDLNISLQPTGGQLQDFPTPASAALIIDTPVLGVSNSPEQPAPATHAAGATSELVGAAFRLNALNGGCTVNGITFTTSGTGDWSSDVNATTGVAVYHDNGDGVYSATDDTLLDETGGASPIVTTTFNLTLATGEIADLWVVIRLTATAGQGIAATPETFIVSINDPATDVSATIPAAVGMPAPNGITVGAIEFNVSNFDPASALSVGGQAITISGSGFMAPLSVTIGGTVCPGTPVIAGGTQVTGLTVPPGVGANLLIVVHSGNLPPQTLTQTFTYTAPKDTGTPSSDDGSGCASSRSQQWTLLLAALGLLAAVVALRRRWA